MRPFICVAALAAGVVLTPTAKADNGTILQGLVDLPRLEATAPIDGCAKITKGLIHSGGFLVFTCEKLLPYFEISEHKVAFENYKSNFLSQGWKLTHSKDPAPNKVSYTRTDLSGCRVVVDLELWKDRSMNESMMDVGDRNNHRQIVFKAWFKGKACDPHYPTAQRLAGR